MKTIILCGGTGMRLKEETEYRPKPMVEVGGKPILWHIMKIYAHYNYRDFILALGFKADYVKDYFLKQKYYESDFCLDTTSGEVSNCVPNNNFKEDKFSITFVDTGLETPHGERVMMLKKYITEDLFMVTYGDGVSDINIERLIKFHNKMGKIATITGVHPTSRWGLVKTYKNGVVKEFAQKPVLFDYVNGGFMVFNRKFFKYLRPGDMIEDTILRLIPLKQLALYKHEGFWYGMDTYKDFNVLNKIWEEDPKWKVWK